jgi:hypothetical protein
MIFSNRAILILAFAVLLGTAAYFSTRSKNTGPITDVATVSVEVPTPTEASPAPLVSTPESARDSGMLPSPAVVALSERERDQLRIVDDVVGTNADNDPRMDRDLKVLSPAVRQQLRLRYHQLASEKRNSKGTLVFLLGRNLNEPADLEFFKEVLSEPPCLSLADCTHLPTVTPLNEEDEHNAGLSVALAYPQMVALHAIKRRLDQQKFASLDAVVQAKLREIVEKGLASKIPQVVAAARELQQRLR